MIETIVARRLVGTGWPIFEGTKLAKALLERDDLTWTGLTVDLRGLPAALLIGGFFGGFLTEVSDRRPELLETARAIVWTTDYAFQAENIANYVAAFERSGDKKTLPASP